jgi:hypothetical protein
MTFGILEVLIAVQMLLDFRLKSCLEQFPCPLSGDPLDSALDLGERFQ